ncbi:MAG: glycosyltransferase family 2 protein [Myxococcales bacterium]|nr:glycosyltransferase family 2 protein [Myxococcales bacterium]
MSRRKLLVIVPCLNEEEALPRLLDRLDRAAATLRDRVQLDVLVVDDGSVDGTAAIARARGARVARLSHNLGIGAAVQTGLRLAARDGYDWAAQIDGDGQHPPDELAKLLDAYDTHGAPDLIIGSRFLERVGFQSTRLRRVGIGWLSFLLRLFAGIKVVDPTSGFRLFGRRALQLFDEVYPYDYPEPESLAIAGAAGLTLVEVQVHMEPRQGGLSSIFGLRVAHYMLCVSISLMLTVSRHLERREA